MYEAASRERSDKREGDRDSMTQGTESQGKDFSTLLRLYNKDASGLGGGRRATRRLVHVMHHTSAKMRFRLSPVDFRPFSCTAASRWRIFSFPAAAMISRGRHNTVRCSPAPKLSKPKKSCAKTSLKNIELANVERVPLRADRPSQKCLLLLREHNAPRHRAERFAACSRSCCDAEGCCCFSGTSS